MEKKESCKNKRDQVMYSEPSFIGIAKINELNDEKTNGDDGEMSKS